LNWQSLQQNLPVTPVTDIKIFRNDLILSTMGHSFWIMDDISPLRFYKDLKKTNTTSLAKPKDVIRYRHRATAETSIPNYPASAVVIDYFLNEKSGTEISMEILDADKKSIQSIICEKEGAHRMMWDMKHRGAWDANPKRSFSNGPNVVPGTYYVLMKTASEEYLQQFEILSDPKLKNIDLTNEDLKKQEKLSLKLVALSSRSKKLIHKIELRRKEIAQLIEEKGERKKYLKEDADLSIIKDKLVMAEGIYMTPRLNDQINYLNRLVGGADQKPSENMLNQFEKLTHELNTIEEEFKSI